MSTALIVDASNLFSSIKTQHNAKLNYASFVNTIDPDGQFARIAFGTIYSQTYKKFITVLRGLNFDVRFRDRPEHSPQTYYDWSVHMALDVVRFIESGVTNIIFATSSPKIVPVLRYCKEKGIHTVIMSCNIPQGLKDNCNEYCEIDPIHFIYNDENPDQKTNKTDEIPF